MDRGTLLSRQIGLVERMDGSREGSKGLLRPILAQPLFSNEWKLSFIID